MPEFSTVEISPIKPTQKRKEAEAIYSREELLELLEYRQAEVDRWKGVTIKLQSQLVMQRVYCGRLRRQLQAKEQKGKKKESGMLKGNGLGRVVTTAELMEAARIDDEAAREKVKEKEARVKRKEDYEREVKIWEKHEEERKRLNEERDKEWKKAKTEWENAKAAAKRQGQKVKDWTASNPMPKKSDDAYCALKGDPRPKKVVAPIDDDDAWATEIGRAHV